MRRKKKQEFKRPGRRNPILTKAEKLKVDEQMFVSSKEEGKTPIDVSLRVKTSRVVKLGMKFSVRKLLDGSGKIVTRVA